MATDYNSPELVKAYAEYVLAEELTLKPVLSDLLQGLKGKNVVDLGCGDGRYSLIMAKLGAQVIGVDRSELQLKIARAKFSHPKITYLSAGADNAVKVDDGWADFTLMNMLVPDLDGADQLHAVLKEAARILKKDGRLILSNLHPLYLSPQQDPSDRAVSFKPQRYFDEGHSYQARAVSKQGTVVNFNETHFSLSYLFTAITKAGFKIDQLVESKQVLKEKMYLPKYLIFVGKKT